MQKPVYRIPGFYSETDRPAEINPAELAPRNAEVFCRHCHKISGQTVPAVEPAHFRCPECGRRNVIYPFPPNWKGAVVSGYLPLVCPSCRKIHAVSDEFAGQFVSCPDCGAVNPVPHAVQPWKFERRNILQYGFYIGCGFTMFLITLILVSVAIYELALLLAVILSR